MNVREQELRLSIEARQVNDAVSCIFHSLLLHRSVAKFHYRSDNNYSLGSLGVTEVDCDFIDLTYVKVNSTELACRLQEEVQAFREDIESGTSGSRRTPFGSPSPSESAVPFVCAHVGIEFYQKKRRIWPMPDDVSPWERWNVVLDIFKVNSTDELNRMRETVAVELSDKILHLCSTINKSQYLPKMPTRTELNQVFDTSFCDVQPYLFRVCRPQPMSMNQNQGVYTTARRLLRDTLAL